MNSDSEADNAVACATAGRSSAPLRASKHSALSLTANFRWTLTGNIVNAVCQWGMLSALARLGSPEAVGQFVLGLSIAAPVMALTMLQLRSVQVTDVRREFSFADYFGTRILWTIVGFATIVGCAMWSGGDRATILVVIFVGLMKCADSVSDIVRGLFQSRERMDLNGISLMVKGVASLLVLAVVMSLTGSVVIASAVTAAVWGLSFFAYDLVCATRLLTEGASVREALGKVRPRFRPAAIARLSWIAVPLGIVMALISLQTNIPRYVLQAYGGSELLGYFGAIVYPIMAGMMVTTALGESASPRLARYFAEDLAAFVRLLARLSGISAALGLALIAGTLLLGGPVLRLLYGPEYAAYDREFVVMSVAWGVQLVSSCWGYGMTAARHFRTQVALTVASCMATTAAAFVLVPRYGVMGASVSVLVTSLAMAVGFAAAMYWAVRRRRAARVVRCTTELGG